MSAQINMKIDVAKDPLLARWIVSVNRQYPRYVGAYALEAIRYYAKTGEYLCIAEIPTYNEYYVFDKKEYYLSILRDDIIEEWVMLLKSRGIKINPTIKAILSRSIKEVNIKDPNIPSLYDLIELPIIDESIRKDTKQSHIDVNKNISLGKPKIEKIQKVSKDDPPKMKKETKGKSILGALASNKLERAD